jgi:hypothetical protein
MTNYVHILSAQQQAESWSLGTVIGMITATIAILLSLWSLLHSIWLGQQNGLPILGYLYNLTKDGNDDLLGYSIQNTGLGPAIYLPPMLYFDGAEIGLMTPENHQEIENFFQQFGIGIDFLVVSKRTSLNAGGSEFIIWLTGNPSDSDLATFKNLDERIDLVICYRSVYSRRRRILKIGATDKPLKYPWRVRFPKA